MSTTSPGPSPGASATETALLALTTPFVQESDCASIWSLSSIGSYDQGTTSTVSVLVSNVGDEHFSSCQPSGWDSVVPGSRFSFSPAVCPSHWTYFDMSETISYDDEARVVGTYSTAICCASGFSRPHSYSDFTIPSIPTPCQRTLNNTSIPVPTPHSASATGLFFTQGLQIHEPWHITWHASDTDTLTPSLPTLTNSMIVPKWVAGETIPDGKYDMVSDHKGGRDGYIWFLMIGLPIIGAAIIGAGIWCCVAGPRRRDIERRIQQEVARRQGGEQQKTPAAST